MRLRAIDTKLLREVWKLRGQMISIAAVVACGVMTVVTMQSSAESLATSRDAYYEGHRFADVFVTLNRAPETLVERVRALPEVAAAETRVVLDVNLDVPGLPEPATGRLVSLPTDPVQGLNRVHLVTGRFPTPDATDEVVVGAAFAGANGLEPGDRIGAVIDGRWERLHVVGVGMSPEYVYEIGLGQLFPDNRRFGVLWMHRGALAPAAGMDGAFNDLVLKLARGGSEPRLIAELDRMLSPFGAVGAFGRDEQLSNRILEDELRQNRSSATILPAIFLGVAAFLLHIVLSRMVRTQRDQIAVLKAFGYSNLEIGRHYLRFALVAVAAGAIVGTGLGIWLGRLLLDVYALFFQFPALIYEVSWGLLLGSVVVSAFAAALGALSAVRSAVALPPAEAMRPEAPPRFRPGLLERIGFSALLSPVGRMIVRTLERQPIRAAISSLAIAMSIAILLVGSFMFDAVDFMADHQFRQVQREDITVVFGSPRAAGARLDLASIEGVTHVEPFRSVPIRLRAEHRVRTVSLLGLPAESGLRRVVDLDGRALDVPEHGLLVSGHLARLVGVGPGDRLRIEVMEGRQPVREVPVAGVVEEMFGMNAYMEIGALNRLMQEGPTISGAYLRVDELQRSSVNQELKRLPIVAGVAMRHTVLENFERQTGENLLVSMSVLILFAGVIAVGVIYNGARIALAERGRELASLRVLGFTRREIAVILFGEQTIVTLAAIPFGFLVGVLFAKLMISAFDNESYRTPMVVEPSTYTFAAAVAIAAAVFAGILVRRRLDRLDLVEVLKTRE